MEIDDKVRNLIVEKGIQFVSKKELLLFGKMSKREARKFILGHKLLIPHTEEVFDKLSLGWKEGIDIEGILERPILCYSGWKQGVFTDGYFFINDKEVSRKIYKKLWKSKRVQREAWFKKEMVGYAISKTHQFPNYEKIIPKVAKASNISIVGYIRDCIPHGKFCCVRRISIVVFDGERIFVVGFDRIVLVMSLLSIKNFYKDKVLIFIDGGRVCFFKDDEWEGSVCAYGIEEYEGCEDKLWLN